MSTRSASSAELLIQTVPSPHNLRHKDSEGEGGIVTYHNSQETPASQTDTITTTGTATTTATEAEAEVEAGTTNELEIEEEHIIEVEEIGIPLETSSAMVSSDQSNPSTHPTTVELSQQHNQHDQHTRNHSEAALQPTRTDEDERKQPSSSAAPSVNNSPRGRTRREKTKVASTTESTNAAETSEEDDTMEGQTKRNNSQSQHEKQNTTNNNNNSSHRLSSPSPDDPPPPDVWKEIPRADRRSLASDGPLTSSSPHRRHSSVATTASSSSSSSVESSPSSTLWRCLFSCFPAHLSSSSSSTVQNNTNLSSSALDCDAKAASRVIDAVLRDDQQKSFDILKLLLLGTADAGKSTIFKQSLSVFQRPLGEDERDLYAPYIRYSVLTAISELCRSAAFIGDANRLPEPARERQTVRHAELKATINSITENDIDEAKNLSSEEKKCMMKLVSLAKAWSNENHFTLFTEEIGTLISRAWKFPIIQHMYECRDEFPSAIHCDDSARYFLDCVTRISANNYVPTQEDVIRVRIPTIGVAETRFEVDGQQFLLVDVGGQRSERRKWMHCFDGVVAVLFVCALSEYNQYLLEDRSTNRLVESFLLFEEVVNSKWFTWAHVVLFLNKKDLLSDKLSRFPFHRYFPHYTAENDEKNVIQWIAKSFQKLNRRGKGRELFIHVTCATDRKNVKAVFQAVREFVMKDSLNREADTLL